MRTFPDKLTRIATLVLPVLVMALAAPVYADWSRRETRKIDDMIERIEQLEEANKQAEKTNIALNNQIRQIQNLIDSDTLISVLERLDLMQSEAAELRELTEQTGYSQERMQSRLREIIIDFDRRIQELRVLIEEMKRQPTPAPAQSTSPTTTPTEPTGTEQPSAQQVATQASQSPPTNSTDATGIALAPAVVSGVATVDGANQQSEQAQDNLSAPVSVNPLPDQAPDEQVATQASQSPPTNSTDATGIALAPAVVSGVATVDGANQQGEQVQDNLSAPVSVNPLPGRGPDVLADESLPQTVSPTTPGVASPDGVIPATSVTATATNPTSQPPSPTQTQPESISQTSADNLASTSKPAQITEPVPKPEIKPKPSPRAQANQAYAKALRLFSQRQYKAALNIFAKIQKEYPQYPQLIGDANYWAADCHYNLNQMQDALSLFKRLEKKFPNHRKYADGQLKMGYVLHSLGQFDEAEQVLSALLDSDREDIVKLAIARLRRVQFDQKLRSR